MQEPQLAAGQPHKPPVKRRTMQAVRMMENEVRSQHEVQVARNVTAILRGMIHAELQRLAEKVLCEDGDPDCE